MTNSTIQRSATAYTSSATPKLYRDPMLNAGSLLMFDFLDGYSNQNVDGALSVGATFNNMVDGGPSASVNGAGFSSLSGKAGISGTGGSYGTDYIDFGAGASYDLSGSNDEYLMHYWFKIPSSGYTTTSGMGLFEFMNPLATLNLAQWGVQLGSDGKTPEVIVAGKKADGTTATSVQVTATSGAGQGAPCLVSQHWKPGQCGIGINGVIVSSQISTTVPSFLLGMTGGRCVLYNIAKATHYRMALEDLTVSGNNAAVQMAAEYAANASRFT
ncbi:MAG: hypothetical protein P4L73_13360 [Caulobacteraceae bacterium]|nr:hypothetical protein [Caulobacteraceae bacterium]